nr:DUF6542 domain-containing protein [Streptomyces cyaneogriseus]
MVRQGKGPGQAGARGRPVRQVPRGGAGRAAPVSGRPGTPRAARKPARPGRPAPRGRPPLLARAVGVVRAVRRMSGPRLTGLGTGVFCLAVMAALGSLDRMLFGSSLTVYGVLFLPVCALTGLWVRPGDVLTAPIVVPIAFALGLVAVAESGQGAGGRLAGLVTALAMGVGWLYAGTLLTGLLVVARRIRLIRRRAARSRPPR